MQDNNVVVVIGYSGHAYVAAEILIEQGFNLDFYTDQKELTYNPYGLKYLGFEADHDFGGWDLDFSYVLGIGNNRLREKTAKLVVARDKPLQKVISNSSSISKTAHIGNGVFVSRGALVNAFAEINDYVVLNTGCIIEHECIINCAAHIGPGAVLAGGVSVGRRAFVGANTVIAQGVKVGDDVIIGAGSVIINDIPNNVTPMTLTTDEDTAGTIDLSSFASDVDGDDLTYSITTDVTNGTTSLSGSTVTYTPTANYNGTDSFTWSVTDGSLSASGTVDITVNAVNDAPTTDDIATTIDENRMASRSTGITLQGSDVDGDDLTYTVVSGPSNGTASISGATLTYEANQDYNGTETITYKANDGTVDSNTSTITITITPVNDTPVVTGTGSSSTNSYSMKFTGDSESYLTIPTPATDFFGANDSFTIGMWFNQQSTNSEEVLIHASANGGTGFQYSPRVGIKQTNQTIEYYIANGSEIGTSGGDGTITIDYDITVNSVEELNNTVQVTQGSFMWANGVKDTSVVFVPSNNGRFNISWTPPVDIQIISRETFAMHNFFHFLLVKNFHTFRCFFDTMLH